MPTEQEIKRIRIEFQEAQTRAKLFGISLEELLKIESPNQSQEIQERRARVKQLFGEKIPLSEPRIVKYLIQRARNSHAPIIKKDSCDVCGEPYDGAYSICGDCGNILQRYL